MITPLTQFVIHFFGIGTLVSVTLLMAFILKEDFT